MKDLPTDMRPELTIGAVLAREDARDVLISRGNEYSGLSALPAGAVVGTSSIRRRAIVLMTRPDVRPRELRGNVDTRVRKVLEGQYDAAILALAGMKRIGLLDAVGGGAPIPVDQMVPAVGQGAICAQCRADDAATREILAPLDDAASALETAMERAVLRRMGGGCLVPIGAHASVREGSFTLAAVIVAADGSSVVRQSASGRVSTEVAATAIAERMADDMLAAGGRELVDGFTSAIARES
jgi:hydroxymethylbilane synthase